MKRCPRCSEKAGRDVFKPEAQFPIRKDRGGKPHSYCSECQNELMRESYAAKKAPTP